MFIQNHFLFNLLFGVVLVQAYEISKLKNQNLELAKQNEEKKDQLRYLADILNRNGITLDDFDLIALPIFKLVEVSTED